MATSRQCQTGCVDDYVEGTETLTLDLNSNLSLTQRWQRLPECDEFVGARRSKHTSVAYDGSVYIFGGDNGKQMLNDLLRFDPSDGSWSRAFVTGQLPTPRYHHTAVVHNSSMYVFGGYTGDIHSNSNLANKNDLYEYKFSSGQWALTRPHGRLPPARSAHGVAVFDDHMWIFGGFDGNSRLNDMWKISLNSVPRRWEEVKQKGECPPPCCNFAVALQDDHMYLFSGQSGARNTNSLFQFCFSTQQWTRISTGHILRAAAFPPYRRYGHTMVSQDRHLYVFGGAAESIHSPELNCYDLKKHAWAPVTPVSDSAPPAGRLFHSAVVIRDSMYVFGGTIDNNVRSNEMWRFQFSTHPRCTLNEDFGTLLANRTLVDVQFLVGFDGTPVSAHTAVVAARCKYLRDKIRQSGQGSGSPSASLLQVSVPEATVAGFEMLLSYIYTDEMDPTQHGFLPGSDAVVVLVLEVYRLALLFSLPRLESLLLRYLETMIDLKNVLAALQNASKLDLQFIKDFCLRFAIKDGHYDKIVMSKEFDSLEQPLLVEMARKRLSGMPSLPETRKKSEVVSGSLRDDLRTFLDDGVGKEFSDISLCNDSVAFPVHKAILAARSAYFAAAFRDPWKTDKQLECLRLGEVTLSDSALHFLVRHIYFGAVEMTPEDALYLFAAPPYLGFTNNRLQVFCKENLETNIRLENVLEILEAADRIDAVEMKRQALQIVVENFALVAEQQKIQTLDRRMLLDIITAYAQSTRGQTHGHN